jgi:transposase
VDRINQKLHLVKRGSKCKACAHPARAQAEKLIASGVSVRETAKRTGVPYQSLQRHQQNCVPKSIARYMEKRELKIAGELVETLVDRVERLQSITTHIMDTALLGLPLLHRDGTPFLDKHGKPVLVSDGVLALKAVAQARRNLELIGRLTGELNPAEEKQADRLITFADFEALYVRVREGKVA